MGCRRALRTLNTFEYLCRAVLMGTRTVHFVDLELKTNSAGKREAQVLNMPVCGGYWSFKSVESLLKPSSASAKFVYCQPLKQNFPGIDAIISRPLLLFQYSVNGVRNLEKDEPLLNMLCTLAEKYDLRAGPEIPRSPFFFVVPNDKLATFQLHPSSIISSFLAKPECRGLNGSEPSERKPTLKRQQMEGVPEASCSRQEGPRCWYCRCLKYFHFYVMGIPGFLQEPKEYLLKKEVVTIDSQGAFQSFVDPLGTSVGDVSEQLESVAIQSDQPDENMSISN